MQTPGSSATTGFQRLHSTGMYYLALPLIAMTFCSLGGMTRYVRASMIDALSMDCIKTARAKGLSSEKAVIYSHAWRNALIPIVTLVVGWFTRHLLRARSDHRSTCSAINGMGKLMIAALRTADDDVTDLLMQLFYVLDRAAQATLIIDIVYGLVDPRVQRQQVRRAYHERKATSIPPPDAAGSAPVGSDASSSAAARPWPMICWRPTVTTARRLTTSKTSSAPVKQIVQRLYASASSP